jgi:hypothetical protein
MSRAAISYSAGGTARADYQGFDPDTPTAGFYRTRLRSGSVYVGVRIWFGPPKDPASGEEMDRAPRWQSEANGRYVELSSVWPGCARDPISASDYAYLASLQTWGEQHAPDSAYADPSRKIDLLSPQTPLPF